MFIIIMIVDRRLSSREFLSGVTVSDATHTLHSYLSSWISLCRAKHQDIKTHTHKQRNKTFTSPYLTTMLCDEKVGRIHLVNNLCSIQEYRFKSSEKALRLPISSLSI